jgi:hypothetical protein
MPNFGGFVYTDAGVAIAGATVNLFDRNTVTSSRANTTTNSNGFWNIDHATEGQFDIQITSGSSVRRIKYDDERQFERLEVSEFLIRGTDNAFSLTQRHASTANFIQTMPGAAGTQLLDGSTNAASAGVHGTDVRIFKNSDEAVTSSTVLQDDDDFFWESPASVEWYFRLAMRTSDGGAAGNIIVVWTLPSGASFDWWQGSAQTTPTAAQITIAQDAGGAERMTVQEGIIHMGGTAGTIQLQWAQDTSDGTATKMHAESVLFAMRLRIN